MKKQLDKLNLIMQGINPELFYSITFTESSISLQGYFNKETVLVVRQALESEDEKFTTEIDKNGIVIMETNNIRIALT